MFGMGGSEMIFILIIALLFLGPDKLPQAAKTLSKGIRDLKKQSRLLQQQIENDERIGGAIRDIKSALRGDEEPAPRRPVAKKKQPLPSTTPESDAVEAAAPGEPAAIEAKASEAHGTGEVKLPALAGEADPELPATRHGDDAAELAALIKPAPGTVAKAEASTTAAATNGASEPGSKHG